MKIGDLVRFAHEKNGGPVHRIVSVMDDGMVEINDIGGYFAPASMKDMRARFEAGDVPQRSIDRTERERRCRVCSL